MLAIDSLRRCSFQSEDYVTIADLALTAREVVRVDLRPGLGPPKFCRLRSPPICLFLIPKLLKCIVHVRIRLENRSRESGEMFGLSGEIEKEDDVVEVEKFALKGPQAAMGLAITH